MAPPYRKLELLATGGSARDRADTKTPASNAAHIIDARRGGLRTCSPAWAAAWCTAGCTACERRGPAPWQRSAPQHSAPQHSTAQRRWLQFPARHRLLPDRHPAAPRSAFPFLAAADRRAARALAQRRPHAVPSSESLGLAVRQDGVRAAAEASVAAACLAATRFEKQLCSRSKQLLNGLANHWQPNAGHGRCGLPVRRHPAVCKRGAAWPSGGWVPRGCRWLAGCCPELPAGGGAGGRGVGVGDRLCVAGGRWCAAVTASGAWCVVIREGKGMRAVGTWVRVWAGSRAGAAHGVAGRASRRTSMTCLRALPLLVPSRRGAANQASNQPSNLPTDLPCARLFPDAGLVPGALPIHLQGGRWGEGRGKGWLAGKHGFGRFLLCMLCMLCV